MIAQYKTMMSAVRTLPIRGGVFIGVCGPSGSGKDSVIAYARDRLQGLDDVTFVRRVITREADAATEDHDTLDEESFAAAERKGAFAVTWEAHDLRYGLPATVDTMIARNRVALANISRAAVPRLRERYACVASVLVTAPLETLAARLSARGREDRNSVRERLERADYATDGFAPLLTLDNSGPLHVAGERLVQFILECRLSPARGADAAGGMD